MFNFAHSLSVFLLAQADVERDMFQWGRIHQNTDWILPLLVVGVMFLYIYRIYKKDAVETARPLRRRMSFTAPRRVSLLSVPSSSTRMFPPRSSAQRSKCGA